MMEDHRYIGPRDLANVLSDLMERINRIKVMLWAGDATAARAEMQEIRNHHELSIVKALGVKTEMLSRTRARAIRTDAKPKYLEERRKGWELDYLLRAEIAKHMSAQDEAGASLFAIAPVASLVTKLDRRISGETDQRRIFEDLDVEAIEAVPEISEDAITEADPLATVSDYDEASGFRLLVFSRGDQTSEMRGYQLSPPALNTTELIRQLKERSEAVTEELEEDANDASWPIRIHGFSPSGHFKLTVLDPGRFSLVVVLKRGEDRDRWFRTILNAIAKSQSGKSPVENPKLK